MFNKKLSWVSRSYCYAYHVSWVQTLLI